MSNAAARSLQPSLAERVRSLLQRVNYRRADTDEDREEIFRLRYEAYLDEGAIEPNFGQQFSDRYDELDNAWSIGIRMDGRFISSMRVHVATREYPDMVAADVFPEFVKPMIEAGNVVVDPTRFVVDPGPAGAVPGLAYLTVRIGTMAAEYFQADYVLATVRAEHQAFYRKVFDAKVICEPRPYPGLIKPLSLMVLNLDEVRDRVAARYPFFVSSHAEQAALFGQPAGFEQHIRPVRPVAANDETALAG